MVERQNPLAEVLQRATDRATKGAQNRPSAASMASPEEKPVNDPVKKPKPVSDPDTITVSGPLPPPRPKLIHKVVWMREDQAAEIKALARQHGTGEGELIRAAWDAYMGREPGQAVRRGRPGRSEES